ncbi:hypothetical protein D9757_010106 [Collybiopsis confluens]|uniref:Uncharacterized protein n=1 Tax=Collybiopsis confluens TaxID=2823264 RepID=A0A8H5GLQ3_9AGAR|nr:hypothetical protein D9757_010106 [Collybiopsis confluens]
MAPNIKVRGTLTSDPLQHGCTWLHLDSTCKIHLSPAETSNYREWRESITRNSQNTDSSTFEDPTASFFRSLTASSSVPTSIEGSTRSASPALRKVSRKVRNTRLQLYENHFVLDRVPPKLKIGELDAPDSLGWRWYQCKADVQILLPPDAGVQYATFLMLEHLHLNGAASCKTADKFNKVRQTFNDLCIRTKMRHPIRGIASTARRYALPVGFRVKALDRLVGRPQDSCEHLISEDLPSFAHMLSDADEYWRRWLCIGKDLRVLLPADTAAQLAFLCRTGVSQPTHPLLHQILRDFQYLSSEITTEQLLATQRSKFYVFPLESHSQTLDESVAHIEITISRSARKQVKPSFHPRWRSVVHELELLSSSCHNDSSVGERGLPSGDLPSEVPRRVVTRRSGKRNLKAGNVDKALPPLPLNSEAEQQNLDSQDRHSSSSEKIWLHRRTRLLT